MELPNLAKLSADNIQAAYMEWMAKNSPEAIKAKCLKTLDRSAEEILRKLLGFDKDSWDGWKLDHCNGRAGESAAGDYIRKHQAEAVNAWLSQVDMPILTATMKRSVKAQATQVFERAFKTRLQSLVEQYAKEQADAFFTAIIESQSAQIADQMKALQLLLQNNKD